MKSRFTPGLLMFLLLAGCSSTKSIDSILGPVSDTASLDIALDRVVSEGFAPGLSVAVVKGGQPVYLKGFGHTNASRSLSVQPGSGFNLWSISKVFTALAVLDLVEEGKLSLDASICPQITWLEGACGENSEARTIRMLLEHTAGVPDIGLKLYGETQFQEDEILDQRALAARLLPNQKKWSAPQAQSRYSNSHYLLLAGIVEEVTGQPFAVALQERVLQPMGLSETRYRYPKQPDLMAGSHPVDITSFMAFFYVDKQRAVSSKRDGRYWFNPVYNSSLGSTGLVSDGNDMSTFMLSMLSCLNDQAPELSANLCTQLRDAKPVKVAKSPARGIPDLAQRLGWFVAPTSKGLEFAHGGSGMGYTAMLQLYPEQDLGVFVIANDSYFDRRGGYRVASAISGLQW